MTRSCISLAVAAGIALAPVAARGQTFSRGDADGLGTANITDAVLILKYLFQGGLSPIGCMDAADVNDDGRISIADGIGLLRFLFGEGDAPAAPFPGCGWDHTDDALGCESARPCGDEMLVFCVDKSSSLSDDDVFERVKAAVNERIAELPEKSSFIIVLFDVSVTTFPPSGAASGHAEMKEEAAAMLASVQPGYGSCPKEALIACVKYASEARGPSRIVFHSDGMPYCNGQDIYAYANSTCAEVTARNTAHIPIDTVYWATGTASGEPWMRRIADQNDGTFQHAAVDGRARARLTSRRP